MSSTKRVVGGVVVAALLLPSVINIATNAFPQRWIKYSTWIAIPLAVILTMYLIFEEIYQRSREKDVESTHVEQDLRQRRQPIYTELRDATSGAERALWEVYGWLGKRKHFIPWSEADQSLVGTPAFKPLVDALAAARDQLDHAVSQMEWAAMTTPASLRRAAVELQNGLFELHRRCHQGYVAKPRVREEWFQDAERWRTKRHDLLELMRKDLQSPRGT